MVRCPKTAQCDALVGPVFDLKKPSPPCRKDHPGCKIANPSLVAKENGSFFCYIPLTKWLPNVVSMWSHQLCLVKDNHSDSQYLHDLSDGDVYKEIVDPKAQYPTLTITLTWDGAEPSKQGTNSIWPLCAFLNELPFTTRIHNAMLIGLHCGPTKPKGDLMFRPLIDELEKLEREPITITINGTEQKFIVKLLLFIADGPARAAALNCAGHTCKYGCHMCDVEFAYDSTYKTPIFKTESITSVKYLDNKTWSLYATSALETRAKSKSSDDAHVHGVKGPCELMRLKYLKLCRLFPPEAMHSMYEGNVKSILKHWLDLDLLSKAWFSSLSESTKSTYRSRHMMMPRSRAIEEIDKHLAKIKFPRRALKEMPKLRNRGQFKSMDYELLVFYGCICFTGIIKEESLTNFMLLALILSKLSARKIDRNELSRVRMLVDHFLKSFEKIYGNDEEKYMWRSNIHHLAHLCDAVQWYGPLFIQSAYFTESLIGVLLRKVVSGTNIPQQVFNKFTNQYSVLAAVMKLVNQPNSSTNFIEFVEDLFPQLIDSNVPVSISKVYHDPAIKYFATPFDTATPEANLVRRLLGEEWNGGMNLLSLKRAPWAHPDFGIQAICTYDYNSSIATKTNNHCIKVQERTVGCLPKFKYYIICLILQDAHTKKIWTFGKELLNVTKVTMQVFNFVQTEFDYMSTYDSPPKELEFEVLNPMNFCEFATYCENVHGKNFVFDIFNRHM